MAAHSDGMRPLHEVLSEICEDRSITQARFAAAAGLKSQQHAGRVLKGDTRIKLEALPRIEDALGLPRGFILRAAGYVAEIRTTEDAIRSDPALDEVHSALTIEAYRLGVRSSSVSGEASNPPAKRTRAAR